MLIHLATGKIYRDAELLRISDSDIRILREVQRGMLQYMPQKEIAAELGYVFASSLRQQLTRLREKFGANSVVDLINKAVKLKILRGSFVYNQRWGKRRQPNGRDNLNHPWRNVFAQRRAQNRHASTGSQK